MNNNEPEFFTERRNYNGGYGNQFGTGNGHGEGVDYVNSLATGAAFGKGDGQGFGIGNSGGDGGSNFLDHILGCGPSPQFATSAFAGLEL